MRNGRGADWPGVRYVRSHRAYRRLDEHRFSPWRMGVSLVTCCITEGIGR